VSGYRGLLWGEAFCRQIVDKKYRSLVGRWCTKQVIGAYGVNLWKHISVEVG
jgi:hypothetical protein